MKKLFLTLVLFLISLTVVKAQEIFEGTIYFDVKIDAADLDPQTSSLLPKETTIYLSDGKICTYQKTMLSEQKVIVNTHDKMLLMLISIMGQNISVQSSFDEILEDVDQEQIPEFTYLDEYLTIAGYKCQKVVLKDKESEIVAYVTEEIKGFENMYLDNLAYNKLKGIMLRIDSKAQGMNMSMTAREVKKGKVDDSIFAVPDDYQQMTMKEFRSLMGGGR